MDVIQYEKCWATPHAFGGRRVGGGRLTGKHARAWSRSLARVPSQGRTLIEARVHAYDWHTGSDLGNGGRDATDPLDVSEAVRVTSRPNIGACSHKDITWVRFGRANIF
jgi:hypothetical protein